MNSIKYILKKAGNFFTIGYWLEDYSAQHLKGDLQAGLTVGVVLVPQCLAYAIIAGVPPVYGLYACIIPLLLYPFFGTSPHIIVSTIALDMIIIAAGVGSIAVAGTGEYIALVTLLALLVGAVQLLMYFFKMGFLINYLSRPVITGFAVAAALIIISKQAGNLAGIKLVNNQYIYEIAVEVFARIGEINPLTLLAGSIAILFLLGQKLWKPQLPGYLFVMVLGIVAAWGLGLPQKGVNIIGEIPTGLPTPAFPELSLSNVRELLSTAITLALVQFMTISTITKIYATKHRYPVDSNRELLALGVGNVANGFFRAMPVSASFSCSAINEQTGSRSALSHVFAAAVIVLTLLFFTPLFYYLPYTILAAVVIMAAINLINFKAIRVLYRIKRRDGIIALFTFAVTLLIGIQEGILLGIGASLVAILYREGNPNVAELGHLPGTRTFKDITRYSSARKLESILILRIDASFSFTNAELFKNYLMEKIKGRKEPVEAVIIDASAINDLDTTALDAIEIVIENLEEWNINLCFSGLKGPVRDVLKRAELYEELGKNDHIFHTSHEAVVNVLNKCDLKGEDSQRLYDYRRWIQEKEENK